MILTGGEILFWKDGQKFMSKKYLLKSEMFERVKRKIFSGQNIFLFFDYDGTLAPFAEEPSQARVFPGVKDEILKLIDKKNIYLSIVSGRGLADLKSMLKIDGLNYAGSHGLEIELSFVDKVIYPHFSRDELRHKLKRLQSRMENEENVRIEDKGFAVAFHCKDDMEKSVIKDKLEAEINGLFFDNLEVISGRQVVEVRPSGWHKGKAVHYISDMLRENYNLEDDYIIYIGDDRTDEDAFEFIKDGLSIYVKNSGDLETAADYYLKNPKEVYLFLRNLL